MVGTIKSCGDNTEVAEANLAKTCSSQMTTENARAMGRQKQRKEKKDVVRNIERKIQTKKMEEEKDGGWGERKSKIVP